MTAASRRRPLRAPARLYRVPSVCFNQRRERTHDHGKRRRIELARESDHDLGEGRSQATTTKTGLKVESVLDTRSYRKGIKVSKAAMKSLDITGDQFHPEWNYTIRPRPPQSSQLLFGLA